MPNCWSPINNREKRLSQRYASANSTRLIQSASCCSVIAMTPQAIEPMVMQLVIAHDAWRNNTADSTSAVFLREFSVLRFFIEFQPHGIQNPECTGEPNT
jgi:hypothetical protein